MAPSTITPRTLSSIAAVLFVLTSLTAATSAASDRVPASVARRSMMSDRLVVRTRAGLSTDVRNWTFAAQGAAELARNDALGASVIRVPRGRMRAVERALRQSGYFKSVEPDYIATAMQDPNDPQYSTEWHMPKIGVPTAWNVTLGSPNVVVAIVDTGIDLTHPDLRNQVVPGYDLVNNDADPSDDNGHGTRMAGVVAAEAFNGEGVAGVAPLSKVMPVKVLSASGSGAYSTVADGITYAVDHGARVINLSLAGTAASAAMQSAIDYATARGAVVVAAAGNFGTGDPAYPGACANAVAVSASDIDDTVTSFSTYGSWVSLAAPGSGIVTTNWSSSGTLYLGSTGTSPAAAVASGAFALLLSAQPGLSSSEAVARMTSHARDLNSSGWDPRAGWGRVDVAAALGVSQPTPTAAPNPTPTPVGQDRQPPTVSVFSPVNSSLVYGTTAVDVTASDDVGVTRVELVVDSAIIATDTAPPFSFVWDTTTTSPGKHKLVARAYDGAGNRKLSRSARVDVTSGVGLLVKRARVAAPRRASDFGGKLTLNAIFVLPEGVTVDQVPNSFNATLQSQRGTVLATADLVNAMVPDTQGRMRITGSMPNGSGGTFKVVITKPKKLPTYSLTLTATGVTAVNADALMSLALSINGATLSQSVPFRLRAMSYSYP